MIKGYTALIDRVAYGLPVIAFVSVRVEKQTDSEIEKFERGVMGLEQVIACYLMSEAYNYFLHVLGSVDI